jgi:hypothetical protein
MYPMDLHLDCSAGSGRREGHGGNATTQRSQPVGVRHPHRVILALAKSGFGNPSSFSASRCVTSKDKVGCFGLLMAGEAGFHESCIARFAVCEVPEPPAAGCGVLFRVLDHELNVGGRAGNKRLDLAKDFVVFVRRDVTVMQSRKDCAVRKRKLPLPVGFDRDIVAQDGT